MSHVLPPDLFVAALGDAQIALEPGEVEQLGAFIEHLLAVNQQFNLTRITEPADAWMRHVFDSLTLLPWIVEADAETVVDIGSGGGLPAIPLAIALPAVQFTLVESTGKKAKFLRDAIERLGLNNARVIEDRAETIGSFRGQDHKEHRERYDLAMARAVGRLNVLAELTVPLVKVGGHVLAIKGERAAEEIAEAKQALHALHAQVVDEVRTPTGTIVVLQKRRKTPRDYPRRPGEPKRAPL